MLKLRSQTISHFIHKHVVVNDHLLLWNMERLTPISYYVDAHKIDVWCDYQLLSFIKDFWFCFSSHHVIHEVPCISAIGLRPSKYLSPLINSLMVASKTYSLKCFLTLPSASHLEFGPIINVETTDGTFELRDEILINVHSSHAEKFSCV